MRTSHLLTLSFSVLLAATACTREPSPPAHAGPPFKPTATIRELMDAEVDPSADAVWDSVGFIATTAGTTERRPRTDEEWLAVRRHALTLIEATNLLMIEGRHAAPANSPPPGAGELTPAEIDRKIEGTRISFDGFAQGLREASLKALEAIDAKDPQALMDVGGTIDEACEACHVAYWYPNQRIPGGS